MPSLLPVASTNWDGKGSYNHMTSQQHDITKTRHHENMTSQHPKHDIITTSQQHDDIATTRRHRNNTTTSQQHHNIIHNGTSQHHPQRNVATSSTTERHNIIHNGTSSKTEHHTTQHHPKHNITTSPKTQHHDITPKTTSRHHTKNNITTSHQKQHHQKQHHNIIQHTTSVHFLKRQHHNIIQPRQNQSKPNPTPMSEGTPNPFTLSPGPLPRTSLDHDYPFHNTTLRRFVSPCPFSSPTCPPTSRRSRFRFRHHANRPPDPDPTRGTTHLVMRRVSFCDSSRSRTHRPARPSISRLDWKAPSFNQEAHWFSPFGFPS